ncbi:MAG TPA: hypothetical protein VLI69_08210 [Gammaproteobacteria bacterium]|nr:hypothetical protein [Gammaproteobacteria bacterium]
MNKQTILTRICTTCGIEKPLSAFLYLSSKQGATYGQICASCRGAGQKEKISSLPPNEDEDEHGGETSSGARMGAKQLLEIELQKKQELKENKDWREKKAKKREQISLDKMELLEQKEKDQKFHRKNYLETQQGFLRYQTKNQVFGEKSMLQKKEEFFHAAVSEEKHRDLEASKLVEVAKEEQQIKVESVGSTPLFDPSNKILIRQSPHYHSLRARLSTDSPIAKAFARLYAAQTGREHAAQPSEKKGDTKKETPHEFIERNWGPSSRKQ